MSAGDLAECSVSVPLKVNAGPNQKGFRFNPTFLQGFRVGVGAEIGSFQPQSGLTWTTSHVKRTNQKLTFLRKKVWLENYRGSTVFYDS